MGIKLNLNPAVELPEEITKAIIWYERKRSGRLTRRTFAVLWTKDERFVGVSKCNKDDVVDKKLGRKIALGRALHAFKYKVNCPKGEYYFFKKTEAIRKLPRWLYIFPESIRDREVLIEKIRKLPSPTEDLISEKFNISIEDAKSLLEESNKDFFKITGDIASCGCSGLKIKDYNNGCSGTNIRNPNTLA